MPIGWNCNNRSGIREKGIMAKRAIGRQARLVGLSLDRNEVMNLRSFKVIP